LLHCESSIEQVFELIRSDSPMPHAFIKVTKSQSHFAKLA
jgi:hypothetical protein